MKIIIDGRLLLPTMTGIGRYLMGLAQGLSQLKGGHHYEIWVQKNLPENHPVWKYQNDFLTLKRLEFNHMVLEGHWRIPQSLQGSSYDLFHYPHFDLPALTPGKVVVTIHDLKYITYPEFFPYFGSSKKIVMMMMMYYTVRRASLIIAVSQSTKNDIVQKFKVNPEKINVIPEGVDKRFFEPYPSTKINNVIKKYQITPPFFLFVGERRPHKNLVNAVKSFELFTRKSDVKYQFIISGRSYVDYDEPEKCVRKLGLEEDVQFIYVTDVDLPVMYQAADGFVTLSYYEGFGLPVIEAMASGTPVIASNTTSLPEIIGEAGILVDPNNVEEAANAMVTLAQQQRLRDHLIQAGIVRAAEFTWEQCAQKTLDVYTHTSSSS